MSTIKQMREVCQLKKKNAKGQMVLTGQWFNRLFARKFTIYITWLFVKLGISANTVTFMMIPMGIIGAAMMVPHILWMNIAGFIILIMAEMFDLIDGEIARWTGKSSIKGVYLDQVSHILCNPLLPIICSLHLYVMGREVVYLVLGFITYAVATIHLELRNIGILLSYQISSNEELVIKGSRTASSMIKRMPFPLNIIFILAKWLSFLGTDLMAIRLVTLACVIISYFSLISPMKVFAYFFVIFEIIWITSEIGTRFFYRLPETSHKKKIV